MAAGALLKPSGMRSTLLYRRNSREYTMHSWKIDPAVYDEKLGRALIYSEAGKVTKSLGLIYEAHLPGAGVGSICRILTDSMDRSNRASGVDAEVIGFRDKRVMLMPFEDALGVNNDSLVVLHEKTSNVLVGKSLLGRVID